MCYVYYMYMYVIDFGTIILGMYSMFLYSSYYTCNSMYCDCVCHCSFMSYILYLSIALSHQFHIHREELRLRMSVSTLGSEF